MVMPNSGWKGLAVLSQTNIYGSIMQYLGELGENPNGYAPIGTAYEFYLNDPTATPENELLTKIMFPLND